MKPYRWIALLSAVTVALVSTPIHTVQAEEGEAKAEINRVQKKQDEVQNKVKKLEKEIKPLKEKAAEMEKDINRTNEKINSIRKKMKKNEKQLEYHQKQYQDSVKFIYEQGGTGSLESLLTADSVSEFLARLEMLRLIAKEDEYNFRKYEEIKKEHLRMTQAMKKWKKKQKKKVEETQKQYRKIDTQLEKAENLLDNLGNKEKTLKASLRKVAASLYPLKNASTSGVDPWGFYNRQCTSFVAWRLNRDGIDFSNTMKGGKFGNASNWDDNARKIGYAVNDTPTVGSVAQWNPGAGGAGSAGHVAYVTAVNGSQVTVEEYNWEVDHGFSKRTVDASEVSNFIHFTE
ncbi:CHAP domain-containing protein [Melghirimyces profundicolus]|uniref:CHAP domain-containing protein n=1 Tax=Melghirimyces profundicolus TaxID=1242148 RepID=A0A2T6B2P8_9BACL|nr:CHAP domain-containing protein [Melghirimyces profundicolus]PTX50346.1 CHAP domain-containing protein [Melghirimyces profundicolus]